MNLRENVRLHLNRWIAMVTLFLFGTMLRAQDLDVDLDVDDGGEWYTHPIAWVIGGAVFILLLVALLRGGGTKE